MMAGSAADGGREGAPSSTGILQDPPLSLLGNCIEDRALGEVDQIIVPGVGESQLEHRPGDPIPRRCRRAPQHAVGPLQPVCRRSLRILTALTVNNLIECLLQRSVHATLKEWGPLLGIRRRLECWPPHRS